MITGIFAVIISYVLAWVVMAFILESFDDE